MIDPRTPPNTVEDALAMVGDGYLVLPVEIALRACALLGVSSDAPGPPIVSWRDGDDAWQKCGLAGEEGPGQGVESVALSHHVAEQLGIVPPPGAAFAGMHLTHGKQASANMEAIRELLLQRGVQGPASQPDRLIPTGWPTYPLRDEMLVGRQRAPAEIEALLAHGFLADQPIRSASGTALSTYRVVWKGQVEGDPAFGKYATTVHDTVSGEREPPTMRDSFGELRAEFAIDLAAWYWMHVQKRFGRLVLGPRGEEGEP